MGAFPGCFILVRVRACTSLVNLKRPIEDTVQPVAALLCTGGPEGIRKEAWPFHRTISGVRLCWELKDLKEPKRPWSKLHEFLASINRSRSRQSFFE